MNHKFLFIAAGIVIMLFLVVAGAAGIFLFQRKAPVTLTYWGLWEPEAVFSEVLSDYKRSYPNVTVKYVKQSPLNYRERSMTAVSSENGPDIMRIHNSWLPMLKNYLAPAPAKIFSPAGFKNTFYPVAAKNFILSGQVYAVPLEIDTLVMFVNDDLFRSANVEVPTTWDGDTGLLATAKKLTVRDGSGRLRTAGAALGAASNIDHWPEIVGLMMLQTGVDLDRQPDDQAAADALAYYASFSRSDGTWDETWDNATFAFSQGTVGIYFAPSWRYFDLKALNPNLNFHLASTPQLTGGATVNYASYWAEAVSKKSKNSQAAWEFLQYLSSKDTLTKLYAAETKLRGFGEPYSRVEMASLLTSDPNAGVVISAAPTAKSWYLASFTNDGETGINSRINKYYLDAINSVLRGADAKSALTTAAQGVEQVLGSYGVGK